MDLSVTVVAGGLGILLVSWFFSGSRRKRSMSFSSSVMVSSAFPPEASVAPPVINILFLLGQCPSPTDVSKAVSGVLYFSRFRSVILHTPSEGWFFKELSDFDPSSVIEEQRVASEAELQQAIEEVSKLPMKDLGNHPAWAVHLIRNSDGLSAMVVRIHHAIGDGMSLVSALARMFDEYKDADRLTEDVSDVMPKPKTSPQTGLLSQLQRLLASIGGFFFILGLPNSPYDSDIKFTSPDKRRLRMTESRTTVLFPSLRLEFIKQIKAKAGVTVNDVMMAITAGAIRRYCEELGDPALSLAVQSRALVPVAFPRPAKKLLDPELALQNYWAFISCPLAVGSSSSRDRLVRTSQDMSSVKSSSMAPIQMFLQTHVLPLLPQFIQRKTAYDIFSRHSLVFSNVPGPPAPIHFCGEKVLGIQVIFPNLLPQTLIISYAGEVFMNMVLDTEVIKDGETLLPRFYLEEALSLAKAFDIEADASSVVSPVSKNGIFSIIS